MDKPKKMSAEELRRRILGSPQYIQEKWLHDRSCDLQKDDKGLPAGEILQIVQTPHGPQSRYVQCRFCARIREMKQKKAVG